MSSSASASHDAPPAPPPLDQLWVGNIPAGLSEAEAKQELSCYNIRPWKLVVRQRGPGQDGLGNYLCVCACWVLNHPGRLPSTILTSR